MGIIKVEWGFREDIRNILFFLFLLQVNYYKFHKNLRYDASKFRLLRFTLKYFLIATGIAVVLMFFGISGNVDSTAISTMMALGVFIPYLIFLAGFLIFYVLQIIYLCIRSLFYTIGTWRILKRKE